MPRARCSDKIVCVSETTAKKLLAIHGRDELKGVVVVQKNVVDTSVWYDSGEAGEEERQTMLREMGVEEGKVSEQRAVSGERRERSDP